MIFEDIADCITGTEKISIEFFLMTLRNKGSFGTHFIVNLSKIICQNQCMVENILHWAIWAANKSDMVAMDYEELIM